MTENKLQLRRKMKSFLWLIPNFLKLIGNLLRDRRVSKTDKAILAATVLYTISPIDLIADFIPFLGLVDDAFLIAVALTRLLYRAGEEPLLEHWEGEEDIVSLVDKMRRVSGIFLPKRIRQHLLGKVKD
jgi:uncharacterized membrane protein YkvA (DUF1232 family)